MSNRFDSEYISNDKFEIYEDGNLMENGAKSNYFGEVSFVRKSKESFFALDVNEIMNDNGIRFSLEECTNATKIFLHNVLEFLTLPNNLLYKNNQIRTDYIHELLNIRHIIVSNAIVDQYFLLLMKNYFNNLEELHFNNCIIKSSCCFNAFDNYITSFSGCTFDSLRCLNDLKSYGLSFRDCTFNNVGCIALNVKRLDLQSNEDDFYKNIFLHFYFPKLDELHIKALNGILDKSVMFLSSSCPNIYSLNITANDVKNYDYLYNLPNLHECNIDSFEHFGEEINANREFLNYSTDDLEIYLDKKVPKIVYKADESIDDNYYLVYDDIKNNFRKRMMSKHDKLYSWKHCSWIEEDLTEKRVWRAKSPVICPKASMIHPTGKVLFFSTNPYNYIGEAEKESEKSKNSGY